VLRHEHQDHGFRLPSGLETERPRCRTLIPHGFSANAQYALAIFAADDKAGCNNGWKHKDAVGLTGKFA